MSDLVPGLVSFVALTLVLGGAAAVAAGQALAATWRAPISAMLAAVPLAGAVRFLHYSLAHEPSEPAQFLLAFVVLAGFSQCGYRLRRARQMRRQYPWLTNAAP
jgi:hypothetical protein